MQGNLLRFFFIIVFTLIYTDNLFPQYKLIKPLQTDSKVLINESGHIKSYYSLQAGNSSVVLIKGPGTLRLITRAVLKHANEKIGYSFSYSVDGGDYTRAEFYNIENPRGVSFQNKSSGRPGIMKTTEIELGPGDHSIEFKSGKNSPSILMRYYFKKNKSKKIKWVMLSPSPSCEPVDLVIRENVIHYYRFSETRPLKISINGPTVLRIMTRFENHYNMKGRINYRIQLKERNKIIHTYLLSSVYSEVTTYRHNSKLVPGKAREFYIQVPPGRHHYTIIPLDKDKNTILARILFPKKHVKLEE